MHNGTMRIMIHFHGDMASYRENVDVYTTNAAERYYDDLSAMSTADGWTDLLDNEFQLSVSELNANLVRAEVIKALEAYSEKSTKIDLEEQEHSCVQWVFINGKWVAIYNYDLVATPRDADYVLKDMDVDLTGLHVGFRAVVHFEVDR